MRYRGLLQGICCAVAISADVSAYADTPLVSYNFDYDVLDSGPDTYQVFQHRNAKASITESYASSGFASAHLTDEAGDKDFVEFQGYFPQQTTGIVHFHFSFLVNSTNNVFNVALVGKERYTLSAQGINFWLIYQNGWLRHKSDGIPKKLFQPNLYEWYTVDAALDLDKGRYALRINSESGDVPVQLDGQLFAPGAAARYSLMEYSFVGDIEDFAPTDVYIDDVTLSASNAKNLPPLVAPGRRKFFVEIWDDYHKKVQRKLQCLPAKNLEDFGIDIDAFESLVNAGKMDVLLRLTRPAPKIGNPADWKDTPELSAIVSWLNACDALDKKQISKARTLMNAALIKKPDAYIYQLSSLLVDAAGKQDYYTLVNRAYNLQGAGDDIRQQIALAMIAFHAKKPADAELAVNDAALTGLDAFGNADIVALRKMGIVPVSDDYKNNLQRYMPNSWEKYMKWMLAIEQQYYVYLWSGNYSQAYLLVEDLLAHLAKAGVAPGIWLERKGDVAFFSADYATALRLYDAVQKADERNDAVLLKMADVYHLQGEMVKERQLRELIYRNFSRD